MIRPHRSADAARSQIDLDGSRRAELNRARPDQLAEIQGHRSREIFAKSILQASQETTAAASGRVVCI
jgi:hypothetical protein